jgi:uncharacterized protein (DUF1697 family)
LIEKAVKPLGASAEQFNFRKHQNMKYIAFLRGINVGGHKLIKMEALGKIFEGFGLQNVKTVIASGNVMFEAVRKSEAVLARQIEKGLYQELGYEVDVMLRALPEIEEMIRENPFEGVKPSDDVKMYVTFLAQERAFQLKFPFKSPKKDFEILSKAGREVFSLSFRLADGHSGNSAGFIEKTLKIPATTRNWNTLLRISALAKEK